MNGNFGLAVASLPDVNGDGMADVLVGAFGEAAEGGAAEAGRAYIFNGATAALLGIDSNPGRLDYNGDAVLDIGDLIHDLIVHP